MPRRPGAAVTAVVGYAGRPPAALAAPHAAPPRARPRGGDAQAAAGRPVRSRGARRPWLAHWLAPWLGPRARPSRGLLRLEGHPPRGAVVRGARRRGGRGGAVAGPARAPRGILPSQAKGFVSQVSEQISAPGWRSAVGSSNSQSVVHTSERRRQL